MKNTHGVKNTQGVQSTHKDNQNLEHISLQAECICTSAHGLFVPRKQLAWVVCTLLLAMLLIGAVSFYGGKWYAAHEFGKIVDREAFVDKIYASVFSFPTDESDAESSLYADADSDEEGDDDEEEAVVVASLGESIVDPVSVCYGEVAGFGTEKCAQQYAQKLAHKGYPVMVKKRVSTSARGKQVAWYQVVTEMFEKESLLEEMVQKLTLEEHLKDKIRIVYS